MRFKSLLPLIAPVALAITSCAPFVDRVEMAKVPPQEAQAALGVRLFLVGTNYPEIVQTMGAITAYSCKNKMWDKPASTGDALAQLRLKALRLGANAVIDVTTDTRGTDTWGTNCWETVQASGTAVVIQTVK